MSVSWDDARPVTSPWFGNVRRIIFDNNNVIWVHESVINKHRDFASKFRDGALRMPGIPREAAHVVVNFLYTNKYETLRPPCDSGIETTKFDFKVAAHAHCLAHKYCLPGLERLAEGQLQKLCTQMDFCTIVEIFENSEFDNIEITGKLHDYLAQGVRKMGSTLANETAHGQAPRTRSMSAILMNTIAEMGGENERLRQNVQKR